MPSVGASVHSLFNLRLGYPVIDLLFHFVDLFLQFFVRLFEVLFHFVEFSFPLSIACHNLEATTSGQFV